MRSWPLLLLAGCSDLSRPERDALLRDQVTITADVEARLDAIEALVPPEPTGHGKGDGLYSYEGTLDPIGAWDAGSIDVIGTGQSSNAGSILTYDLRLTYAGVDRDGTVYDGATATQISIAIADGDVSVSYVINGDLACEGDISGDADMDWTYSASSLDGGRPHYTGTINGRDVSN